MSIIKREKSSTGIYHVLAQGAGNHELFLDDEDYQVFVEYLARLMKEAWAEDDDPDTEAVQTYREGGEIPGECDYAEYIATVLAIFLE